MEDQPLLKPKSTDSPINSSSAPTIISAVEERKLLSERADILHNDKYSERIAMLEEFEERELRKHQINNFNDIYEAIETFVHKFSRFLVFSLVVLLAIMAVLIMT